MLRKTLLFAGILLAGSAQAGDPLTPQYLTGYSRAADYYYELPFEIRSGEPARDAQAADWAYYKDVCNALDRTVFDSRHNEDRWGDITDKLWDARVNCGILQRGPNFKGTSFNATGTGFHP